MTTSTTLIEFLLNLMRDPAAQTAFQDDPQGYLASCGVGDVSPADVHDALVLLEDNQHADFSRDHNTGGNSVHVVPPPPAPHPAPGVSEHQSAIQYLNNYITNNYIDDRDTITDNSVNQQIDTGGGDFDQDIDVHSTVASGDGSVAAGGNIDGSTITTGSGNTVGDGNVRGDGNIVGDDNDGNLTGHGDGNVVGDDNQAVTGHGNTTAFGDGSATSVGGDVSVGHGGAFGAGGSAVSVDNSDHSTNDSFNDNSDHSTNDSFNDSSDHSVHDAGNVDTDVEVHDAGNDNSDHSVHDAGNDNSDNSADNSIDLHS
jgi:hypothetical protein